MLLHCKILRNKQGIVFAQLPQIHAKGRTIDVVRYIDTDEWKRVARSLVKTFLGEINEFTSERAGNPPTRASNRGAAG